MGTQEFDGNDLTDFWSQRLSEKEAAGEIKVKGRDTPAAQVSPTVSSGYSVSYSGKELAPLVKAFGNFFCRRGNVDLISDEEATEVAEPLAGVLTKYFGDAWSKWGAEIALAGILLKLSLPRVDAWLKQKQQEESR